MNVFRNILRMSHNSNDDNINKSVRWMFNIKSWIPTKDEILLATSCVQREEKERLSKFVFKDDFKSSLIGRLLMRKFVNDYTNIPYDKIRFYRDDKGKPIIDSNGVNLSFNISHHGDYVVLAGELDHHVIGVDIMKNEYSGGKSLNEFFRIMNRQFSNNEWMTIKGCNGEKEQINMFCRHWALKESYVKAIGVGITVNLQDINFTINTRNLKNNAIVYDTKLYLKSNVEDWIFEESLLDDDHCVSVALQTVNKCTEFRLFEEIGFQELVNEAIPLHEVDETYTDNFFKKSNKQ